MRYRSLNVLPMQTHLCQYETIRATAWRSSQSEKLSRDFIPCKTIANLLFLNLTTVSFHVKHVLESLCGRKALCITHRRWSVPKCDSIWWCGMKTGCNSLLANVSSLMLAIIEKWNQFFVIVKQLDTNKCMFLHRIRLRGNNMVVIQ